MPIGDGEHWVIMGRPESGYSVKVRSAARFKGVPHEWVDRSRRNEKLFQSHAKVQLIPLVFRPDGSSTQDSTPILDELEKAFPTPSFHPEDPALRLLSIVLEEYGDEWVNKLMFHHRWGCAADRKVRSTTLARGMLEGSPLRILSPIVARFVVRRMVPRMAFAGANTNNRPLLLESWANLVEDLEAHLSRRPYLFGARPAYGDFGLFGQLDQAFLDPTCGAHLRAHGPSVVAWIERMRHPKVEGDFEVFASLEPTLRTIFSREVGPRFLAWGVANERAVAAGAPNTELEMDGRLYYQRTFKYPAVGLARLRKAFAAVSEEKGLRRFLDETRCLDPLEEQGTNPSSH